MARALCQGLFWRPSGVKSGGYCYPTNAMAFCGGGQCDGFAERGDMTVLAGVRSLLNFSRPYAIALAVWTIVVLPLKGMLWAWPVAHVLEKLLERSPFLANGNSAATIAMIVGAVFFLASAPHIYPNAIDCRSFHAVFGVHAPADHAGDFPRKAAAAFRYAAPQVASNHKSLCAAVTTA